MSEDTYKIRKLHSGYLVVGDQGAVSIVGRVGDFKKVLVSKDGSVFPIPDSVDGTIPPFIKEVWGLVREGEGNPFRLSTKGRDLLWKKPAVKLTLSQVCERLGYDVELVKE